MGYEEDSKDPRISRLAKIAQPFTDGFMYEKKYTQKEAFEAFVNHTKQNGLEEYSESELRRGFDLSIYINK